MKLLKFLKIKDHKKYVFAKYESGIFFFLFKKSNLYDKALYNFLYLCTTIKMPKSS